jgi:hypothetical protein
MTVLFGVLLLPASAGVAGKTFGLGDGAGGQSATVRVIGTASC